VFEREGRFGVEEGECERVRVRLRGAGGGGGMRKEMKSLRWEEGESEQCKKEGEGMGTEEK
jgi:hypothetical protein